MSLFSCAFELGQTVKEKHSGIVGRVIAVDFWETGCTRVGVKRPGVDKNDQPHDVVWFEEPNLDSVDTSSDEDRAPNAHHKPGGPMPTGMMDPTTR